MSAAVISIKPSAEAQAILRALKTFPEQMTRAVADAMDYENQLTISHIITDYLSFPSSEPSVPNGLRTITGLLRSSVRASKAEISSDGRVTSTIGSNVKYAAAHEFGATIPPHEILPKNSKALRFMLGGKLIFAKRVKFPGMVLPARAPIQRGIADRAQNYSDSISARIIAAAPKN